MSTAVGIEAETRAARFLEGQGYHVLERNYRCQHGEIDLICQEGSVLCFVEVRARRRSRYGFPEETITHDKKRRISLTARHFLAARRLGDPECRFDVVTILGDDPPTLQRDAFSNDYYL